MFSRSDRKQMATKDVENGKHAAALAQSVLLNANSAGSRDCPT